MVPASVRTHSLAAAALSTIIPRKSMQLAPRETHVAPAASNGKSVYGPGHRERMAQGANQIWVGLTRVAAENRRPYREDELRRAFQRARAVENNAPAEPTSASTTVGFSGESVHPVCACRGTATRRSSAAHRYRSNGLVMIVLANESTERRFKCQSRFRDMCRLRQAHGSAKSPSYSAFGVPRPSHAQVHAQANRDSRADRN